MASILNIFGNGSQSAATPNPENDDIYPLHIFDDTSTHRGISVVWLLHFDDVLDHQILKDGLSQLMNMGDWRKLGGRMRMRNDGKLEIHVPKSFTSDRPAFSYTHANHDMPIKNHPLASTLPIATTSPSIQADTTTFHPLTVAEGTPKTMQDYIKSDMPMISLQITSFDDATLVGLAWPHVLMDAMGQQALLRGWSLVIAGKFSEIPPLIGAREDVVCALADASSEEPNEEWVIGKLRLAGWGMLQFGAKFAWQILTTAAQKSKAIYLPAAALSKLVQQARSDLAANGSGETSWISENDVLTAFFVRCVAQSLPSPRPINALHALNVRFRIPSLAKSKGVYVQNLAVASFTGVSADLAREGSLGAISKENRRCLKEQSSESQVLTFMREARQQTLKSGKLLEPIIGGDPNALLMPFTNWSRAKFRQVIDFSPAVIRGGKHPGRMVSSVASNLLPNATMRNIVVILGEDLDDGVWIHATLSKDAFDVVDAELKRLA